VDESSGVPSNGKTGTEIRFDGRVAIVTGAGGGAGPVLCAGAGEARGQGGVNDLGGGKDGAREPECSGQGGGGDPGDGGEAIASYDSVSTAEGGEAIVETGVESVCRVDIVVNNAGF